MDFAYDYGYQYDYPATYHRSMDDSIFGAILSIYLIVLAMVIIFTLVSYIFHSVGLYTIGKRLGKKHPWMAFIPFARDYFHGEMAGEIKLKKGSIKNPGIWKLIMPIAADVVMGIFILLLVLAAVVGTIGIGAGVGIMLMIVMYVILIVLLVAYSAVYMTLRVLVDIQIYERFTTHNMGIVHAVLSATVPLYEAFCLFVMRNRDFVPGREPKLGPPPVLPTYTGTPVPPQEPTGEAPSAEAPSAMAPETAAVPPQASAEVTPSAEAPERAAVPPQASAEEAPSAEAPETAAVPSQTGAEQPGDGQNQAPTEKTE